MEQTALIPTALRFLLYSDHEAVQVDLDASCLTVSATARPRLGALVREHAPDITLKVSTEAAMTADTLPDAPTDCAMMRRPRNLAESSTAIAPGALGSRVRGRAKRAERKTRWLQVVHE